MDRDELKTIYDKYSNSIYRIALSYTHSVHDAWDIVQTTFLRCMEKSPSFSENNEKAWLTTVAVNACKDILKSSWRRKSAEYDEATEQQMKMMSVEELNLFQAIAKLKPKYRIVIHLYYYEGYTFKEIAEILKISSSAVSMRLHRARELLKDELSEEE